MFIWVEGPKGYDMEKVYWKAIEKNVAFVPGTFFFAKKGTGKETMRLNFSSSNEEQINNAVKNLASVLKY